MFTIIVSFPGNLAVAFFFGNLAASFLFLGNLAAEVFLGQGGIFWLLEMRQKFLMQEFLGMLSIAHKQEAHKLVRYPSWN